MHNKNQHSNCSNREHQNNSLNATHEDNLNSSNKYKNVEPLPESSRPRRDGPGGEDRE